MLSPFDKSHNPILNETASPQDVESFGLQQRLSAFWELPSLDGLFSFAEHYPEIRQLVGEVNTIHAGREPFPGAKSISESMFGAIHPEFDRTVLAAVCLRWILRGEYEQFIACQPEDKRLNRESFDIICRWSREILEVPLVGCLAQPIQIAGIRLDAGKLDTLIAWLAVHDIGKSKQVVQTVLDEPGCDADDHDSVLETLVKKYPERLPSFERLAPESQQLIRNCLASGFHLGNFALGESLPATLTPVSGLQSAELEILFLHSICDIAGASAHLTPNGSLVLNQRTFEECMAAISATRLILDGVSVKEAFHAYLEFCSKRCEGIDVFTPNGVALARIAVMSGLADADYRELVPATFSSLPRNVQSILLEELSRSGIDDGIAFLPYGGAAYLRRSVAVSPPVASKQESFAAALVTLARALHSARLKCREREGSGVEIVSLAGISSYGKSPGLAAALDLHVTSEAAHHRVHLRDRLVVDSSAFPERALAQAIDGKRICVMGVGGGTDGMQATVLAKLLEREGKECVCVVSVRGELIGSQGLGGKVGTPRRVEGAELVQGGVYKISEASRGTGRFFEHLLARHYTAFLMLDNPRANLTDTISNLLDYVGGVDAVVTVDTGGDSLHADLTLAKHVATPDQDLRVLRAVEPLRSIRGFSSIVACGVDAPGNATDVLKRAEAVFVDPDAEQTQLILKTFREWEAVDNTAAIPGKTPLAWQEALRGNYGLRCLELPEHWVTGGANRWNPFVFVTPAMRGIFVMKLKDHLEALK